MTKAKDGLFESDVNRCGLDYILHGLYSVCHGPGFSEVIISD
jgi:hypothetical protein